jgi:hypothetical protein
VCSHVVMLEGKSCKASVLVKLLLEYCLYNQAFYTVCLSSLSANNRADFVSGSLNFDYD